MEITRRGFLGSILALAAAPAIVRASSLMTVRQSILLPAAPELLVPTQKIIEHAGKYILGSSYMKQSSGGWLRRDKWSDGSNDYQFCDDQKREVHSGVKYEEYTFATR